MKNFNWDHETVSSKSTHFTLTLSHHGEGFDGDFNPDDPNDKKLLRYDIYLNEDPEEVMRNGSSCTLLSSSLTEQEAFRVINAVLSKAEDLYKTHGSENLGTITRMLENLDWISLLS